VKIREAKVWGQLKQKYWSVLISTGVVVHIRNLSSQGGTDRKTVVLSSIVFLLMSL
jgi:hypothetical protein